MLETAETQLPNERGPQEARYKIPGPIAGLNLFLRHTAGTRRDGDAVKSILFVHGMSFPSSVAIAHRFSGRSWRDDLNAAGFDVWALDFYGFGEADRYAEMNQPAEINPALGRAEERAAQIESAVRFICENQKLARLSFIAHSAGTIAVGLFANRHPDLVERLVFFGPIAPREPVANTAAPNEKAWKLVSLKDQWDRFTQDVPPGESVLSPDEFRTWGEAYIETDREAHSRSPASVKVPNGMAADIQAAWQGQLGYEPGQILAPTLIVRGEWDSMCSELDAQKLFHALAAPIKRKVEISRATHLMHLESGRIDLYRETQSFMGENMEMQTAAPQTKKIDGYDYGKGSVSHSPISLDDLRKLEQSVGWSDEDARILKRHSDFFHENAEAMVDSWRAVIGAQPQLAQWFFGPDGKPDDEYKSRVKKRFVQWVKDTCDRPHDQAWLDYQEEIGLRHTPAKKNQTDHAQTPPVVPLRYLFGFNAVVITETQKFFEKIKVDAKEIKMIENAWTRAVLLHITLWSRPFAKDGLF